jgi:hypothetical protein
LTKQLYLSDGGFIPSPENAQDIYRYINTLLVLSVLILSACAGGPQAAESAAPAWVHSIEAVYPRSAYIAQKGEGNARRDAELAALGAISYYFESEINARQSNRSVWTERDGLTSAESRTEAETIVRSQTRMVAVRYAEDPWQNPATGKWETAAYLDRNEAWTLYEPQAKVVSDSLLALMNAAENEGEAFPRVLRFGTAASYADGAEFNTVREFAQVLYPSKAQAFFRHADNAVSSLPAKIDAAKRSARIFIQCSPDLDGLIYNAAVAAWGTEGFPVERNRAAAANVCVIRVDEGIQKMDSGVFYYPSLTGVVNGASGALFSFTIKAPRQAAINPDIAKRRAYTALAAAFEEAFPGELNKNRAAGEK